MNLVEGKSYKMRDGRKAGPAAYRGPTFNAPSTEWVVPHPGGHPATYYPNGRRIADGCDDPEDLVSEWPASIPSPIVTETTTRIEPGVYDVFTIHKGNECPYLAWTAGAFINLSDYDHNRGKLRSAIETLTQILTHLEKAE